MTTPWRARLRRLRFALLAAGATVVILLGVLAGLTQLAMPWLERHPQHVEHWLSKRLERPVKIGHLSGGWIGGGPLLALDDVRIAGRLADQPALAIPHAELAFDLYAPFKRNGAFSEFRLSGLDLGLVNEASGWHVRGLDFGAPQQSDEPFSLGALGALEISNLRLTIEDPQRGLHVALAAPMLRLLNRGAITRVLGRVRVADTDSPPLDLVADLDINTRSGEIYVGGRDVDLGRYAAQQSPGGIQLVAGSGAVQLWARVNAARADDVRVRVDLKDVRFDAASPIAVDEHTAIAPRIGTDRLAFVARWLREPDGWTFDLADFVAGPDIRATGAASTPAPAPARLTVERRGDDAQPRYRAGATGLPLEPFGNLAMLSGQAPEGLRRWLYLAHPRGTLARADIDWRGADDYEVNAQLRGIGLASAGAAPGIEHIDLDLGGDAQALLLQLPQQALRVDYPHVFRKPLLFAQFGGDVIARRVDDAWQLETDRLGFEGEGYGGELRGSVALPSGRRPLVDLYALITHGDIVAAKLFWPTITMPPPAIAWLDRALVGGRLVDGRVALRGDLADWPFHDRSGRFVARAEIADATLDYDPNWPRAEKLHAVATFVNDGMQVDVDAAEAMGNKITQASATIADFGPLVLDLAVKGEGSGANLLGFMRATPVGKRYQDQLKDVAVTGKAAVAFTLNLPIKQIEALNLNGGVDLGGAKLDHGAFNLHFSDAAGHLRFNQKGFAADALDVGFRDRKAKLSIAIGGYAADPRHVFEATLAGRFPATTVFADVPVLLPMLTAFPGESAWTASVGVEAPAGGAVRSRLALDSDLRGTSIELPAPLAKAADVALPFHLDLDLPPAGQIFVAKLGDVLGVKGRVPGGGRPFAARVELGTAPPGEPPAQAVVIGGRTPRLDAGSWLERVEQDTGSTGSIVQAVDLRADDFLFANRHFSDMRLTVDNGVAATTVGLDGAAIAGRLEIPRTDLVGRGISAKFARIHWPETPADAQDSSAFADVAPASLPPLHLVVDDFQLGKASFGSAQFESHPIANGMSVDKLESQSPNITMKASGDWTGGAKDNHSRLSIELSAQNLGHMMDALGFPGLIDGGTTRATIDATWAGPPSAFALPKLDGVLDINVAEGRILDVEPGAGRIFGLFSLTEIPRRLSLDFSDFFQSGLSFNSIIGKFRLADGNAYTDGLTINSPAADIVVTGRTGLRAKDYDQRMAVSPHAGATLPIVGAIAAGPVGAAAGLVIQGILNKPLGMAMGLHYQVSGSWDKPKITLVSREKPGIGNREPGAGKKKPRKSGAGTPDPPERESSPAADGAPGAGPRW
ncbi:YhdP family protein [Dokdonella soli]|uniref:YhdP family protein n=1 Tax=Dokdonella soli TaxID=529810 RepID=A0ABN1ISN3_9GAMM